MFKYITIFSNRNHCAYKSTTNSKIQFNHFPKKNYVNNDKIDQEHLENKIHPGKNLYKYIYYFLQHTFSLKKIVSFVAIMKHWIASIGLGVLLLTISLTVLAINFIFFLTNVLNNSKNYKDITISGGILGIVVFVCSCILPSFIDASGWTLIAELYVGLGLILQHKNPADMRKELEENSYFQSLKQDPKSKKKHVYNILENIIDSIEEYNQFILDRIDSVFLNSNQQFSREEILNKIQDINIQVTISLHMYFLSSLEKIIEYIQFYFVWFFILLIVRFNSKRVEDQNPNKFEEGYNTSVLMDLLRVQAIVFKYWLVTNILFTLKYVLLSGFYFIFNRDRMSMENIANSVISNYETVYFINLHDSSENFFTTNLNQNSYLLLGEKLVFLVYISLCAFTLWCYRKDIMELMRYFTEFSQCLIPAIELFSSFSNNPESILNTIYKKTQPIITFILVVFGYFIIDKIMYFQIIKFIGDKMGYHFLNKLVMNIPKIIPTISMFFNILSYCTINNSDFTLIKNIIDMSMIPLNDIDPVPMNFTVDSIEFMDAHISYNKSYNLLNKVNTKIRSGEVVFLTGQSGSGKSTLVKSIMGDVYYNKGDIFLIDERNNVFNAQKVKKTHREKIFAYCPQTISFPQGTIKEFFMSHCKHLTDQQIYTLLEKVNLYEDIINKDDKIHSDMGNNGSIFSGGQRARLYIAAMLAKRHNFSGTLFMILDETLDSVDHETTVDILMYLIHMVKKKQLALIVISHKMKEIINMCNENNISYRISTVEDGSVYDKKYVNKEGEKLEDQKCLNQVLGLRINKPSSKKYVCVSSIDVFNGNEKC